jgi:hypothetical protein
MAMNVKEGNNYRQDKLIVQKLSEIFDKVDCLQRAVALLCGQTGDLKAEYTEDMTDLKRILQDLQRNKVWACR